jgi:hypothetical protein
MNESAKATKFCKHCGAQIDAEAIICVKNVVGRWNKLSQRHNNRKW